jgi:hypothetical protein
MRDDGPSPIRILEPEASTSASASVPEPVRAAARRLLTRDGHGFMLQPWQAAWLIATSEGREGFVPPACGAGRGWLQARLDEELARED